LGGGTPSLLNGDQIKRIFETVHSYYTVETDAEITLEANPDDLSEQKIEMLQQTPINRLSIGIQSLNDDELKLMNRRHTAQNAIDAVLKVHNAGYHNITADLIFGIPGQTESSWRYSLQTLLELPIAHLSAYNLTYEEGTPFTINVAKNTLTPLDEQANIQLFEILIESAEYEGFKQYEISNFARPGFESRHNSSYWSGANYLGIGPSAHSYNGHSRRWNVADNANYIASIKRGEPVYESEIIDTNTRYNEFIITRLRTLRGLHLDELKELFGQNLTAYFLTNAKKYLQSGTLTMDNSRVKLTHKGIFISDSIMRDLLFV
jgi:putative oxygen-independent coproporphyrinogen III oxidase